MWTLDENPNCDATHASFRLTSDGLIPDVVESATGLAADFGAAKGELRASRSGREIRQRTGVWLISSEGQVESTSLERHIRYLLEKVEPVMGKLLAVAREQGATADFYCYWVSASDQGGPGIGPETLGRMSELQGILAFDIYSAGGED
jgi:hypothetical protein